MYMHLHMCINAYTATPCCTLYLPIPVNVYRFCGTQEQKAQAAKTAAKIKAREARKETKERQVKIDSATALAGTTTRSEQGCSLPLFLSISPSFSLTHTHINICNEWCLPLAALSLSLARVLFLYPWHILTHYFF
jgi:hypothetical protein